VSWLAAFIGLNYDWNQTQRSTFGEEELRGSRIWLMPQQKLTDFSEPLSPSKKLKTIGLWK